MNSEEKLKEYLFNLEIKLANQDVRKSHEELDKYLADSFIEFGSSGKIYDKQKIIEELDAEQEIHIVISDFKIRILSSEIVLTNYIAEVGETIDTTESHFISLRSSNWQLFEEKWQMIFHQGTIIKE